MVLSKDDIISNIYYDLESGYGSSKNTFDQAVKKDSSITYEDVRKWMNHQPNKQRKAYRNSNSYVAPYARFEYQMDIMDMAPLATSPNIPGYGSVCIDIFRKNRLC